MQRFDSTDVVSNLISKLLTTTDVTPLNLSKYLYNSGVFIDWIYIKCQLPLPPRKTTNVTKLILVKGILRNFLRTPKY